ncbi:MAG: alanine racemase [Oscillospiraceae bacterium]
MAGSFERRCWAEVDLDILRQNFKWIQQAAGGTPAMAVVKADAYGHGDVAVARTLQAAGAAGFAVSCFAEAMRLRRGGIQKPVLILGYTEPALAGRLAAEGLHQCVFSAGYARLLSQRAVEAGVRVDAHFKIETGMGRLGFNAKDDMAAAVEELAGACRLPGLAPVGLFSHFAVADSARPGDIAYTEGQYALLLQVRQALGALGIGFQTTHICNSAGLVAHGYMHLDMVRPGIILYGCAPSAEAALPGLAPVLQLKTVVTQVKTLQKGDCISYGRTFTAPGPMRVATLAAGYADGYNRLLSGRGVVGIHGQSAPVLGRVCMDQCVADVSAIPGVEMGDVATLFGGGGADSTEQAAEKCGTISYEILCGLTRRVQRVYRENGEETQTEDYMQE